MPISPYQSQQIKGLLKVKLKAKLQNYSRETTAMPFLARLMQNPEQVAAYSFLQSIATTLGMSIYEQIAEIIAEPHYDEVKTGYDVEGHISDEQSTVISKIMREIADGIRKSNRSREMKELLECKQKRDRHLKVRADLYLRKGQQEFFIEIKTAKPNIDVFNKSKQKLLEWTALRNKPVVTILAIPYNPYHPEPYSRFTLQGVLDEKEELYVEERFWDLLGGKGTYHDLLKIFDEVGIELKKQIQMKIKEVAKTKMVK